MTDVLSQPCTDALGAGPVQADDAAAVGTVAIVGLGYVGLPTALAFVEAGARVVGVDISPARLEAIRAGDVDLIPDDRCRLGRALDDPAFVLTGSAADVAEADTVVVCVPTPVDAHQVPDLRALRGACEGVVAAARPGQLIVLTSTTYVGCTEDLVVAPLRARGLRPGVDVNVVFAPERIDPGNVVHTQDQTPRVMGGYTLSCASRGLTALSAITSRVHVVSSCRAAELTKLYENTFRAVNIALANELATVAGELDVDIMEVIEAAATKPYGFMPFYPGPGVGGHCIPCDPHYLLWQLRAQRRSAPLVDAAMDAIAGRPAAVAARAGEVLAEHGRPLDGARVLIVGLAYKPDVADVRESPAFAIATELRRRGAQVGYWDPLVPPEQLNGHRALVDPVADVDPADWDLAVVHTVHGGVDLGWLAELPAVIDATYRLRELPNRYVP